VLLGYPGQFAALLAPDTKKARRDAALKRMKRTSEVWEDAKQRDEPEVKRIIKESYLNEVIIVRLFQVLGICLWLFEKIPRHVLDFIEHMFALPGTKLIEDSFWNWRQEEDRATSNKNFSPLRGLHALISRNLANVIHHYPVVDYKDCPISVSKTLRKKPPSSWFKPKPKSASPADAAPGEEQLATHRVDISKVVTKEKDKPPWPTASVLTLSVRVVQVQLLMWVADEPEPRPYGLIENSWLCMLLLPGRQVVRRKSVPDKVLFPVLNVGNVGTLAWHSATSVLGAITFYRPRTELGPDGEWPFDICFVLDEEQWECLELHWVTHKEELVSRRQSAPSSSSAPPPTPASLKAGWAMGPPAGWISIKRAAALRCFEGWNESSIVQLSTHLGVPQKRGDPLFDKVIVLVQQCLPDMSNESLCELLMFFLDNGGAEADLGIVNNDTFASCFEPSDWKVMEKEETEGKKRAKESIVTRGKRGKKFQQAACNWIKKVKTEAREAMPKRKRPAEPSSGKAHWKGIAKPSIGEPSQIIAQEYMPPNFKVWKDDLRNYYQVRTKTGSCSRSWWRWGYISALGQVVNYAWEMYCMSEGYEILTPHVWAREFGWRLDECKDDDDEDDD
jgi:hypothetical protein